MVEDIIIVTRHKALVRYLKEHGIEGKVLPHATEEDVRDKHVFGVLPMRLAALTASFTEVSLTLTPEQRGKELSIKDIKAAKPHLTTYMVTKVIGKDRDL